MFKICDKVRVNDSCTGDGGEKYIGLVGTVVDIEWDITYPIRVKFTDGRGESFLESELDLLQSEGRAVVQIIAASKYMPEYKTDGAAGADLKAVIGEAVILEPDERKSIPTGVKVAIPPHLYGKIEDRSGLAKKLGLTTLGGVIDPDFRGEIEVVLLNTGNESIIISPGDRIAQIVLMPFDRVIFESVEELPVTERGGEGFGHTGS